MLSAEGTGDLLTADQAGNNAGTDDEGEDEAVHAVPGGGAAGSSGASVVVVQEGEGKELRDQGILNGEQQGRPGNGRGDNTGSVALVAVLAAVAGPLETPVDGTEEGEDLLLFRLISFLGFLLGQGGLLKGFKMAHGLLTTAP